MKKFFKTILVVLSFVALLSLTNTEVSEAKSKGSIQYSNSEKFDFTIVRTVENGISYISIYINDNILIMKVEEL